jgi:hypothetical protein
VRDSRGLAADPPQPEAHAAPASNKLAPTPAKPVRARPVGVAAARVLAVPAQPAAKQGNLVDAIVNAFGGNEGANQRRAQAVQDQNLRNLEAAYRPQFQQLLYSELAFLRRACKPDAKPFVDVARAAKADLRVPLREYVTAMNAPRIIMNGRVQPVQPHSGTDDPRQAIENLLTPLAEAKLGAEKARLYRRECEKRAEVRKKAAVMNLVAGLDERLVLSAQQRAKLVESFSKNYDDAWEQFFEVYGGFNNFFPSIPDASIVPLLDEKQKSVWQETSHVSGRVFGMVFRGNQFGEAGELLDIAHMVEDVKDAP